MPMHHAPVKKAFKAEGFEDVKVGIVDWYNSVIRLESKNRDSLKKLAVKIIESWEKYTDESCTIYDETDGVRHNSLSPVCRIKDGVYVMDMILRNNLTSEQYPDGIFHAHPEYHNIKKVIEKGNVVLILFNDNIAFRLYKDAFIDGSWEECKELLNSKQK